MPLFFNRPINPPHGFGALAQAPVLCPGESALRHALFEMRDDFFEEARLAGRLVNFELHLALPGVAHPGPFDRLLLAAETGAAALAARPPEAVVRGLVFRSAERVHLLAHRLVERGAHAAAQCFIQEARRLLRGGVDKGFSQVVFRAVLRAVFHHRCGLVLGFC